MTAAVLAQLVEPVTAEQEAAGSILEAGPTQGLKITEN